MADTRRNGRFAIEDPNPKQVLFPEDGVTRRDLVDYYERVGKVMLPHLRGRAVTIERYPNGIEGRRLLQTHPPAGFPPRVAGRRGTSADPPSGPLVIDRVASLAWLAARAGVTPHVPLSRMDHPEVPDRLVFDLDPPDGRFDMARVGSRMLARLLADLGLAPFVMANGLGGLQVSVPLDRRADFAQSRGFSERVAAVLAVRVPDLFETERRKARRDGRLWIDTSPNAADRTTVAPYAVRPRAGAPVAAPLDWNEVAHPGPGAGIYALGQMKQRLAQVEDPWKLMSRRARSVTDAARRLDDLIARDARLKGLMRGGFLAIAI